MKKIIRLFAVIVTATVLMAAACICASAGSAEGASLYASQTSAGKGDEITFSVSLSGGKNVKSLSISITFDSGVFELTSGDWSISEGVNSKPFYTEDAAGALSFKKEVDVEGEIFSFSLKVKDGAEVGNSTVSCVIGIEDGTPVSASSDISIVCKHSFTKEEATEAHLKSEASCTAKAVYYYSCEYCGANGTTTFEYGEKLAHTFDKQDTGATHLKSAASCTAKAVYYYSCVCGENGTETFEYGELSAHTYTETVAEKYLKSEANCTEAAVYYKSCNNCGSASTDTFTSGKALGHTGGTATCTEQAVCTRCKQPYGEKLAHTFDKKVEDEKYKKEDKTCTHGTIYFMSCVCGEKGTATFEANDKLPHTFDQKNTDAKHLKSKATCTAKAVYYYSCTCGENGTETFETGDVLGHDYGTKWSSDSKEHWHECSRCGDRKDNAAHNPGAEPTEKTAQTCTICGYVIKPALGHKHNFGSDWQWNGTMHWHSCSGCSDHSDESRHVYDNACDTTCNVCGYERKVEHKYDEKWKTDESKHWHECSVCGAKKDEAAHTPGAEPTETSAQTCTVCGYVIKNALGHTHKFASEWSSDEKNHWHECSCGEKADVSAHIPGDWIIDKEASEGVEGAKHKECTECKQTVEKETIPALPVATTTTTAATTTTTTSSQTTTGKPAGRGCRLTVGAGAAFAIVSVLGMGIVLGKRKIK